MKNKIKTQGMIYSYISTASYDDSRTGDAKNIPTRITIKAGQLKRKDGKKYEFEKEYSFAMEK